MNVLQHFPDPAGILSQCVQRLTPDGVILTSVPNFNYVGVWRDLWRGQTTWRQRTFAASRLHFTTARVLRKWFARIGLEIVQLEYRADGRYRKMAVWSAGLLDNLFASRMIVVGKK